MWWSRTIGAGASWVHFSPNRLWLSSFFSRDGSASKSGSRPRELAVVLFCANTCGSKRSPPNFGKMSQTSPQISRPPNGPKFFVRIQRRLVQSLREIDRDPDLAEIRRDLMRLELFRSVFQELSSELKTYGAFFEGIRLEYEKRLQCLERQLNYAEHERQRIHIDYKELQHSLLEQVDPHHGGTLGILEPQGQEDSSRSRALESMRQRARYAHAQTKLERMEREKLDLVEAMAKLGTMQRDLEGKLKDERSAKTLVFHEFSELQTELSWYKEAQKNQEDPAVIRMALNQSREDLAKVQDLLNDFTFGVDSVIPQVQFEKLTQKYDHLKADFEQLETKTKHLTKENGDLVSDLQEMSMELETLRTTQDPSPKTKGQ